MDKMMIRYAIAGVAGLIAADFAADFDFVKKEENETLRMVYRYGAAAAAGALAAHLAAKAL